MRLNCLYYTLHRENQSHHTYECPLDMAYSRTFQSQHGSSCIAAARWFEVTAIYVPGVIVIVISSWVPGVLEAKSWGTHIRLGATVGDAACRSMNAASCGAVVVVQLLYCNYYS